MLFFLLLTAYIYIINKNMQEISEGNEFLNQIKNRQKAGKQMAPLIQKIQSQFALVLEQARQIKNKFNEVLKFQSQKVTLEKYIKEVRRDLHETNSHLASKAENELGNSKLSSNFRTIKDELHSLERTIERRQEYFENYDKKLNNIMESLSKHQGYVNDRIYIFQDKFKTLTKQTLQMTKDIKKDFDNTMTTNIILKNQLVHKIKNTEEKEKILDLYMSERQEIPKKINDIYNDLKSYLKHNEFQQFKKWHQTAIQQSLSKAKKTVQKLVPQNTQQNLKKIELKFLQIDQLHLKTSQIETLKLHIEALSYKIDSMQKTQDIKITQIREQTEEIEQKIIQVIDKKIETIQQEIQHYNTQNQQSIDDKLQKMREQFIQMVHQKEIKQHHFEQLPQIKVNKNIITQQQTQIVVNKEIETIRKERQIIQKNSKQIIALAQGLNSKLSLFSNRITMCKSDMQIFVENTTRQLRKIIDIRKQQENHMELVGKMFAELMQSIIILTSLTLNEQQKRQTKSYVTYNDGILLQIDKESSKDTINYRRNHINTFDLKQSLIMCLLQKIDQLIISNQILRWDNYKPSMFFNKIKDNLNIKSKIISKSASVHLYSPRRKRKLQGQQDLFFDLKMQSEQLLKNNNQKPTISINSSNILWNYQKPKSQMHKRYKIKRTQDKIKKETQERNCFTASKSHRKTKVIFN